MITTWKNLPNAEHINNVLESLKTDTDKWTSASRATRKVVPDSSLHGNKDLAMMTCVDTDRVSAREEALNTAWNYSKAYMCKDAYNAASTAIVALIAWDNSSDLVQLGVDQVTMLAGHHNIQATLLLPAMLAFH